MTVTKIDCPKEWKGKDDWDSHLPLLFLAINRQPHDFVYEFGIGYGSTINLAWWYNEVNTLGKEVYSFETDKKWFEKFKSVPYAKTPRDFSFVYKNHCLWLTDDYLKLNLLEPCIVFIDCAPGGIRKELIKKHSEQNLLIIHDTEEGAEHVYGMKEILSTFKYRLDFEPKGVPRTTAVSNFVNIEKWI